MQCAPIIFKMSFALTLAYLTAGDAIAYQTAPATAAPAAEGDSDVIIKREALKITDAQTYKVTLQLTPVRTLELTAPVDGEIRGVNIKAGKKVGKEAEAFRLDDSRAGLVLKRAKANLQGAKVEKKIAQSKNDADLTALADAKIEAAQADVDLAQQVLDGLVVRIPFAGEIHRVNVVDGQRVRAGDRLATLADTSRLQVEIPIQRPKGEASPAPVELKIEDANVTAKVDAVLPLNPRFEPMRELSDSIASAVVIVDNPDGRFKVGQTVYTDIIPLAPVTSVPTSSVSNQPDGNRKVQVLRDSTVRDLPVRILGKIGTDYVFVSGRFLQGDELIVSASRELADGTPLRALAMVTPGAASKTPTPRPGSAPAGGKPPVPAPAAKKKTEGF